MARNGNKEKEFKEMVEMGHENARILQSVKDWCVHLDLTDISAGFISEIYGLPIRFRISCKHARGPIEGSFLSEVAQGFVVDSCRNCTFHEKLKDENFGQKVLVEYQKKIEEKNLALEAEREKSVEIREKIVELLSTKASKLSIPNLSILRLVNELDVETKALESSRQLLEASLVHAEFFSSEVIDAMSIHFSNEALGNTLLNAVVNITKVRRAISTFCVERVVELIFTRRHIESATALYGLLVDYSSLKDIVPVIRSVIVSLNYLMPLFNGGPGDNNHEERERFIIQCLEADESLVTGIWIEYLSNVNKQTRINCCRLIDAVYSRHQTIGVTLFEPLMKSLDLPDDEYLESADHSACVTISKIMRTAESGMLNEFNRLWEEIGDDARQSALKIYELLAENLAFMRKHTAFSNGLINNTFKSILDKDLQEEVRTKAFDMLKILHTSGILPDNSFEIFLGCLCEILEEEKLFQFYREELKKGGEKISTFNRLRGMAYIDIHLEETRIESYKSNIIDLLCDDLGRDPGDCYGKIESVFVSLDSKQNGPYKIELIKVFTRGLKGTFYVGQFIPHLYTALFDADDVNVRYAATDFMKNLFDKYPQLVTDVLIGVVDIFAEDLDTVLRGKAREIMGVIARSSSLQLNKEHILAIQKGYNDEKLFVLKKSVEATKYIIPFLTQDEVLYLSQLLINIESVYNNKEHKEFHHTVIVVLFEIGFLYPRLVPFLIKTYAIPQAESGDKGTAEYFVKALDRLKTKYPQFEDQWVNQLLTYLLKTGRDRYNSFDGRNRYYSQLFATPRQVIDRNKKAIEGTAKKIISRDPVDSLTFLFLLAQHEFPSMSLALADEIDGKVGAVAANEGLLNLISLVRHCSEVVLQQFDGVGVADKITNIKYELSKFGQREN
ncbi:MAG TPA: hypothetical protein VGM30_19755 [Puia sp.]|jgi:hypothetical protein